MPTTVDLAPRQTATPAFLGTSTIVGALILAPALEVVESVLSPLVGTSTTADLAAIAAHRDAFAASVLLGLLATILYIPAFLGLAHACLTGSPRLARIGGILAVLSMLGFCGVRMLQAVQLQLVDDGLTRDTAGELIDHTGTNPIGLVFLIMFLGGTVVGTLALAVSAWRAGLAKFAAGLLILFPFVDQTLHGHLGSIVSHVVLLIALIGLAVSLRHHEAHPSYRYIDHSTPTYQALKGAGSEGFD